MKGRKVELLAPAGNYDSFIGAINAGADAVYVGGEKFSARAYADNFDTETLCACIKYAHLFGRKVYLTLNTLIKEKEFSEIYEYVAPFYMAGLDGVIIQDFGVLKYLKEHFPEMELHASTQMAVTGPEFIRLCKDWGISRVVPARELSLIELKTIRDAGIEVECFIHGAMCYCYSGMCLMSSILGGRSGNRGKCAQPCRLPYQVSLDGETRTDVYTLSLKDMCTIEHIPALIEAGMDSFKIEGRMKRSEYAAGVTALYRKYIDLYYEYPDREFKISKKDKTILEHLYMRSELQDGYLFKHNGKEMITKDAPSYGTLDEKVLDDIREKYLGYTKKLPISFFAYFEVGRESTLTAYTDSGISVTLSGPVVDAANKSAATEETVAKQLSKLGNTHFELQDLQIDISGEVFLPNSALNALRREVLIKLEEAVIASYFPTLSLRKPLPETGGITKQNCLELIHQTDKLKCPEKEATDSPKRLCLLVQNTQQLHAVLQHSICKYVDRLYLEDEAMDALLSINYKFASHIKPVYAMPYVLRSEKNCNVKTYLQRLVQAGIKHILVRNTEELALVTKLQATWDIEVITDASLYCWNLEAMAMLADYAVQITLPYELNSRELRPLRGNHTEQIIYGYIPLMQTANCIYKTNTSCQLSKKKLSHQAVLRDRYGKNFTVLTNCKHCYNTIYNSVPLSLHKKYNKALPGKFRIQFSIEDKDSVCAILNYYEKWIQDIPAEFPVKEYTTAHENRQVE